MSTVIFVKHIVHIQKYGCLGKSMEWKENVNGGCPLVMEIWSDFLFTYLNSLNVSQ